MSANCDAVSWPEHSDSHQTSQNGWTETVCTEDRPRIPLDRYRKRLVEVIAAKGGSTSYSIQTFPYLSTLHCECSMFSESKRIIFWAADCLSDATQMKIRRHLMINLCRNPSNYKGFTSFSLQLCIHTHTLLKFFNWMIRIRSYSLIFVYLLLDMYQERHISFPSYADDQIKTSSFLYIICDHQNCLNMLYRIPGPDTQLCFLMTQNPLLLLL